MTASAIIAGSLVDMKNVACHKCLRLVIDVPAEQALEVIKTLGWATAVNPIPVAVARLEQSKEVMPDRKSGHRPAEPEHKTPPVPPADKAPGRAPKAWNEKPLSVQAGILCNDASFQRFLRQTEPDAFAISYGDYASIVRHLCDVDSRSDIVPGTRSAELWTELVGYYRAWQREAEVVPA